MKVWCDALDNEGRYKCSNPAAFTVHVRLVNEEKDSTVACGKHLAQVVRKYATAPTTKNNAVVVTVFKSED